MTSFGSGRTLQLPPTARGSKWADAVRPTRGKDSSWSVTGILGPTIGRAHRPVRRRNVNQAAPYAAEILGVQHPSNRVSNWLSISVVCATAASGSARSSDFMARRATSRISLDQPHPLSPTAQANLGLRPTNRCACSTDESSIFEESWAFSAAHLSAFRVGWRSRMRYASCDLRPRAGADNLPVL